jgi:hypothetical protein
MDELILSVLQSVGAEVATDPQDQRLPLAQGSGVGPTVIVIDLGRRWGLRGTASTVRGFLLLNRAVGFLPGAVGEGFHLLSHLGPGPLGCDLDLASALRPRPGRQLDRDGDPDRLGRDRQQQ